MAKASTGMTTTVMIKGTHGLDAGAALGATAGVSSATASSWRPLRASAVFSAIMRMVYRFMFTTVCSNSSLVVTILELASKARWATIKSAICAERSTLDNSSAPETMEVLVKLLEPAALNAGRGPALLKLE